MPGPWEKYRAVSTPQPTQADGSTPTPVPLQPAPGRQMEFSPDAPYLASVLGLLGGAGATMAAPELTIPAIALRIGSAAVGGAVGGAIDPRDTAVAGAGREGAAMSLGETLGPLAGGAIKIAKGMGTASKDAPRLASGISKAVPWLKPYVEGSEESLTKLFRSGQHEESAMGIAGKALGTIKSAIESTVGPKTEFRFGALNGHLPPRPPAANMSIQAWQARPKPGMTFQQIDGLITDLQQQARIATEELQTHRAIELRKAARNIRNQFVKQLEAKQPGAGKMYQQARGQYANAVTLQKLMGKPGVIDEGGNINYTALQKAVQEDTKMAKRFGTDAMQGLIKQIGRGGRPVGTDIGAKLPVYWHPGNILPRLQMPRLPRTVGVSAPRVPGVIVPAGLTAAGTIRYFTNPSGQSQQ